MTRAARPVQLANLDPVAQLRAGRLLERISRLLAGLALYGLSIALMIEGTIGASPWDVFHAGAARNLPITFGTVIILASAVVLLAWFPLGQRPGLGTLANALLIGPFADVSLALVPTAEPLPLRCGYVVAGVTLCAFATALYVGAQLGPGPRDGLMTGLARRTGRSLRTVRTGIELAVLTAGLLLGGTAGVGTVLFALMIGPLTQLFLPPLVVPLRPTRLSPAPGRPIAPAPSPAGGHHPTSQGEIA